MIETVEMSGVAELMASAGLPSDFQIVSLPGGGNNRVYRVDCGLTAYLLKAYFHHPADPRDRLATEFAFSHFAWENGLRSLPQPLARDDHRHLGLYEFVHGRPIEASDIDPDAVDQAIAFFVGLNRHKLTPLAQQLPKGSEACFTLAAHLACVERRINRLSLVEDSSPSNRAAISWVRDNLKPTWQRVQQGVLKRATSATMALDEPIPTSDRCLSPSDFGFHNAILPDDGRLRFVDFEYAGWDDPAKIVCDFHCQPKLPVPEEMAAGFTQAVIPGLSNEELHRLRISLLLPVYRLKWCCIMLNEFIPVDSQRRNFARDDRDQDERKQNQLEKADRALQSVQDSSQN